MLRDELKFFRHKDFPIKGGYGTSFDDAIEFTLDALKGDGFVSLEYDIAPLLVKGFGEILRFKKQELVYKDDRIYDVLSISIAKDEFCPLDPIPPVRNYNCGENERCIYFDITDCFNEQSRDLQ